MEKKDLLEFKNRIVKIVVKNGWKYSGKVIGISEQCLILDDIKEGKIKFSCYDISSIQELK